MTFCSPPPIAHGLTVSIYILMLPKTNKQKPEKMAELAPELRRLYTLTSVQVFIYHLHIHDNKPPISISVFTLVHAYWWYLLHLFTHMYTNHM